MSSIKHQQNQTNGTNFNFMLTSTAHFETEDSSEKTLALTDGDSNLLMDTTCDPDAVACFLGFTREGHFTPGVIFEFFSVPITDVQAALLASFFIGWEDTELTIEELYSDWMECTFDSRFAAGYEALESIMGERGFEIPPTLKTLNEDSAAAQSALDKITVMMGRIDGPLNQALEERQDLENAEGFFIKVDLTPDEEEDDEPPF